MQRVLLYNQNRLYQCSGHLLAIFLLRLTALLLISFPHYHVSRFKPVQSKGGDILLAFITFTAVKTVQCGIQPGDNQFLHQIDQHHVVLLLKGKRNRVPL